MTHDDGLEALLGEHGTAGYDGDHFYCVGCTETLRAYHVELDDGVAAHQAAVVRAAGWVKGRTVTTAAELDALPVGSLVLDRHGFVFERGTEIWYMVASENLFGLDDVALPVAVLHEPEGER